MPISSGTRLGSYELLAQIGAGGMGEVYQAHDTKLGRDVAIKILPEAFAHDAERLARFQREAKMLAALNHPNIATVHGLERSDGTHFLIMELVSGETLADRIKREGPLPVDEALKIAVQIAEALEAAHEKGIIHRDLKPANVKVTPEGKVKVLDFGLAKAFAGDVADSNPSQSPTRSAVATMQGVLLGTAAYMSPEQARGKAVDKRTDTWAFGCVLYELLTGKRVFRGETTQDTIAAVLEREPDWQALPQSTPAKIRDLLWRCLQKDPQRRMRDMGDTRIEIEEAASAMGAPASAAATPLRPGWRRAVLWGIPAMILVSIAIGFLLRPHSPPEPPVYHQVTFRRGTIRYARFASDGKTILYSASFEGRGFQIYWTRSDSPESTALPFPNAMVHAVSPSGQLAIGLRHGPTVTLAEVPLAGGTPREILDDLSDADWAPDGQNLAVARTVGDRDRIEFPVGNVLYDPGPGVSLKNVRFSPKGDLIAFVESSNTGGPDSIHVVDRSGRHRVVSSGWETLAGLAWNPLSGEIWFSGRESAASSERLVLHAVSLTGKHRVVARVPGLPIIDDIARDGRVLMKHAEWPISMICLPPGYSKEVDLSWFDFSQGMDLSNDGKTILFDEGGIAGGAKGGIYLRGTDGSPAVHLGDGHALGLSPDGQWALSMPNDLPDRLVLLPVRAGQSRVLKGEGLEYHSAEWFPEGKRILFSAAPHGRPPKLYVQEIDGGTPRPITPEGVEIGPVSTDGKNVMGRGPGSKVFLYPVSGGPARPVPGVEPADQLIRWDADGKTVYLTRAEDSVSVSIYRFDPASGRRELWKKLGPADPTGINSRTWDKVLLTPDGKVYAYDYMRDLSELYVVDGLK
jgi:eukaryotic-like serine/threonine-protein kinase